MKDKLPAIQFYPGDWRRDPGVQSLDFHDRGVWFELICIMHESQSRGKLLLNGAPMPDSAVARLLGCSEAEWKQTRSRLEAHGVASICPDTGALINRRMVRDEDLRRRKAEAGAKGGKASGAVRRRQARSKREANRGSSVSSSVSPPLQGGVQTTREGDVEGGVTPGPRGGGRRDPSTLRVVRPSGPIDPEWERAVDESTEAERRLRGLP